MTQQHTGTTNVSNQSVARTTSTTTRSDTENYEGLPNNTLNEEKGVRLGKRGSREHDNNQQQDVREMDDGVIQILNRLWPGG
jgi:hypothetical protein